jgi:hypothetical protein
LTPARCGGTALFLLYSVIIFACLNKIYISAHDMAIIIKVNENVIFVLKSMTGEVLVP